MIKTKDWTEEQTRLVNSILNRIKHLCIEIWENDLDAATYCFLDNVYLTDEEMETIKELVK